MRTLAKKMGLLLFCGAIGVLMLPLALAGGLCVGAVTCAEALASAWRELAAWYCEEDAA